MSRSTIGARRGRGGCCRLTRRGPGELSRAFTLIEAMVAIVLVLALAGVAVPQFMGLRADSELRDGVDEIAAGVGVARAEAMTQGRMLEIGVDGVASGSQRMVARVVSGADIRNTDVVGEQNGRGEAPRGGIEERTAERPVDAGGESILTISDRLTLSRPGVSASSGTAVLVWVLPSGELIPVPGWRVRHRDGREAVLRFGRWTGDVTIELVEAEMAKGTEAPEPTTPAATEDAGGER